MDLGTTPLASAFALLLAAATAVAGDVPGAPPPAVGEPTLPYTRTELRTPRPVVVHQLEVDLSTGRWEIAAVVAPDPDGKGPAQSQLAQPQDLAFTADVQAAINANVFSHLPEAPSDEPITEGLPVLVNGLAVTRDRVVSRPRSSPNVALWSDAKGQVRMGQPSPKDQVVEGVAGFGWLVRDGEVVPEASTAHHPRTAVAMDRERKRLWMVVVDGRQPGTSEGMSLRELADHLRALGAWNAVNLDGGGSSVMILQGVDGRPAILNRPSTLSLFGRVPRPVPVLLGIRRRAP